MDLYEEDRLPSQRGDLSKFLDGYLAVTTPTSKTKSGPLDLIPVMPHHLKKALTLIPSSSAIRLSTILPVILWE